MGLPIPFAAPDIIEDDVAAVARVLRSGWLTSGDEVVRFEEELSDYLGAPHVVAVSSCTAALEICLRGLDLPPGARVAMPTWTFAATAIATLHAGLTPVLLDINTDTLNLSPAALDAALATGIDAVVPVHFAGVPVSRAIHDMCGSLGVPIVEDAAHAFGAVDYRGRVAGRGTVGACFSFYATKNLSAGEGGAIATEHWQLASRARAMRLHGMTRDPWSGFLPGMRAEYDIEEPGLKANMPDVLAALARSQLTRINDLQARRRAIVKRYRAALEDVPGLELVPSAYMPGSANLLMIVLLPRGVDRRQVRERMAERGVSTSVHFRPLHQLRWFSEHVEIGPTGTLMADGIADRALSLPLRPGLTTADIDRICTELGHALRR
jgi:dTDP-4-amino-4,6-dideoxygalactose transaminase